ncbi:MAG: ATP synthase F1 subunit delta [Pirellulales bacterium]|nr:ATP synthase F1 subunit delta [Pirellulales bacterium]
MSSSSQSTAKRTAVDPARQRLGALYAKAILAAAEKPGETQRVVEDFEAIVAEVIEPNPKFAAVLSSALVPAEAKKKMIDRVVASRVSKVTSNSLAVLADHGRLDALAPVATALREQYDALRGRVRVEVRTAVPLNGQLPALAKQLERMFGGQPEIEAKVEPGLIGGIVLRVGDVIYDGSVATQLKNLCDQMINRSVHEIQSGRNRFSPATGN